MINLKQHRYVSGEDAVAPSCTGGKVISLKQHKYRTVSVATALTWLILLTFLLIMSFAFAGCGSDEVISVSDLGKSSETATADTSDGTDISEDGNSSDSSGADNSGNEENRTADSVADTAELVGTWDASAHSYTNTMLNIELTLTEDWTADTSTEGGTILSYSQGGMTATAEFVFDIGGAYEDTDAAWDAYYEYAGLDEDTLLLLAASAYVSYGTDAIGGKDFETLNVIYEADGNETYQYVAIGETEGCVAVLMLSIDAELAVFDSEEAAQNAMQEIVEMVQVW